MALRPILLSIIVSTTVCGSSHSQSGQYRGPGALTLPTNAEEEARNRGRALRERGPVNLGRDFVLTADLTQWQFWWEFNKDAYLGQRFEPALTADEVSQQVVPVLMDVLDRTDHHQRNMVSAAMIALARSSGEHHSVQGMIRRHLSSRDQQIRETAALALGITGSVAVRSDLSDLLLDNRAGRNLVDRETIDDRTRSFAAYGLGLLARAHEDLQVQNACLSVLGSVLEDPRIDSRDVKIAAVTALGMQRIDSSAGEDANRLLETTLGILERYLQQPGTARRELVQAHVPKAISGLLLRGGSDVQREHFKELFLAELPSPEAEPDDGQPEDPGPRQPPPVERLGHDIRRAAALALGQLSAPNDGAESPDAKYSAALLEYYDTRRRSDPQTRSFSLIALAQIGGVENRRALLEAFRQGNRAIEKPWAALALGVYARNAFEAADPGRPPVVDRGIGEVLHEALADNKNPHTLAGLALGLGLARYGDAAEELREMLVQHRAKDELAGYLCVALALIRDLPSRGAIEDVMRTSALRRPALGKQAALALGIFADTSSRPLLEEVLETPLPRPLPTRTPMQAGHEGPYLLGSTAWALARLGSVEFLERAIRDDRIPDLNRAMAITALGLLAGRDRRPWNAELAQNLNYRAAVETLTTRGAPPGILDLY